MARFKFEVVRDLDRLCALAPAWRQLNRRMRTVRHFHVPEWFLALVQALDQYDDTNYLFIVIYDRYELVGIVPLQAVDIDLYGIPLKAFRVLSNIRDTLTTRDIILAESLDSGDVLTAFIGYLNDLDASWDVVVFAGALSDSCAKAAAQKAAALPIISTTGGASGRAEFISCGPDDQPLKRLSQNLRQNLRTAHNKSTSKTARFICAQRPEELSVFYDKLSSVEASGWKQEDSSIIQNNPRFNAFLRNLICYLGPTGDVEIHLMEICGITISAMFCVVVNGTCFIHVIGYNETYSQVSPGNLLMENLIKTRGSRGNLTSITTYYAPPWFATWKPDKTLEVSNIYVFPFSQQGGELYNRLSMLAASRDRRV
jgi:Acetyltransferase (GNAT) domain